MQNRSRLLLASILTAVGALALAAIPASAFAGGHIFTASFGAATSTPANPYPLSSPTDTAVDNSTGTSAHDFYVTDPGNFRVEKFDSSGNFILMFGKDVDQTTGANVCTAASGDTCQAGVSGSSPGAFTFPTFVAVDGSSGPSAGDVYVADTGDNLVSKFDSSGNLITGWGNSGQLNGSTATNGPFGFLAGIAVDTSGNLFVLDTNCNFFKFKQDGSFITQFNPGYSVQPWSMPSMQRATCTSSGALGASIRSRLTASISARSTGNSLSASSPIPLTTTSMSTRAAA